MKNLCFSVAKCVCAMVLFGMLFSGVQALAFQVSDDFSNASFDNSLDGSKWVKNPAAGATDVYQDGATDMLLMKSGAIWGVNGALTKNPINITDSNRGHGANIEIVVDNITVTNNVGGRDVALEIFLTTNTTTTDASAYGNVGPKIAWLFDIDGTNNCYELESFSWTGQGWGDQFFLGDRRFAAGEITFPLTINFAVNQHYIVVSLNGKPYLTSSNIFGASFANGAMLHTTVEATGGAATVAVKSIKVSDLGTPLVNLPPLPSAAGFGTDFDNAAYDGKWDPSQFYLGGVLDWATTVTKSCAQAGGKMVINPQGYSTASSHEGVTLLGTMDFPVGASDALHVKYQIESIEQLATDKGLNSECMLVVSEILSNFGYFHHTRPALSIGLVRQGTSNDIRVYSRSKGVISAYNAGTNFTYGQLQTVTFPLTVEAHVRKSDYDLMLNGVNVLTNQAHVADFSSGRLAAQIAACNPVEGAQSRVTLLNFNVGVNGQPNVPVELSAFDIQ